MYFLFTALFITASLSQASRGEIPCPDGQMSGFNPSNGIPSQANPGLPDRNFCYEWCCDADLQDANTRCTGPLVASHDSPFNLFHKGDILPGITYTSCKTNNECQSDETCEDVLLTSSLVGFFYGQRNVGCHFDDHSCEESNVVIPGIYGDFTVGTCPSPGPFTATDATFRACVQVHDPIATA